MKINKPTFINSSLDSRLTAYAVAGVALAMPALAPSARADIAYSGPLTLTVPQNGTGIYLDLATGQTSTTGSFAGYDINPYGSTSLIFFKGIGTTYVGTTTTGAPSALTLGAFIGSTDTFTTGTASTNFDVVGTEYLGIRSTNTTTSAVNYGWIQFQTGSTTGYPATILGYAFENAGGSILAGQTTSVPEPSTNVALGLGALALGAVAVRRMRRGAQAAA